MNWNDAVSRFPRIRALCDRGYGDSLSVYLPDADARIFERLDEQLSRVDLDRLDQHRRALEHPESRHFALSDLRPIRFKHRTRIQALSKGLTGRGERMLRTGSVGEVILAGGAATRFFKGQNSMPKALYPITPVAEKTFLDIFLQEAVAVAHKYGVAPPVLIMVSEVTKAKVQQALQEHHRFGLPPECIFVFTQAHHPRLDARGRLIIRPDGGLVWYGDGHGGVYKALIANGLRTRLMAAGVHTLVLHNVDNPLARPFDPIRLGFHARGRRLFTMSVYQRTSSTQKVGILAKVLNTGRIEVIEYSEAAPEVMTAMDKAGLLFDCGHINTNYFELSAISDKVPPALYTNKPLIVNGMEVASSTFEVLNQHLTRMLDGLRVGVFAVPEERFFLPTKNMHGPDSVDTTRQVLSENALNLMTQAGVVFHGANHRADLSPVMEPGDINALFPAAGMEVFDQARVYLSPVKGPGGPGFTGGVVVRDHGTFILDSVEPFGAFSTGPNRSVVTDAPPPVVDAPGGVVVGKAATLVIRMHAGSVLRLPEKLVVPDGKTLKISLERNEKRTIGSR